MREYFRMGRAFKFFGLIIVASIAVSGCLRVGPSRSKIPPEAGVYSTQSKGARWDGRNRLIVPGGIGTLSGVSVLELFADPQDPRAIYLSTPGAGLIYTYDAGTTWQQPKDITSGTVNDVSIDSRNTCTVYVAVGNRALKSTDCNRSYREVYIDPRPNAVTAVAVDSGNSNVVYIGTSAGEFLKSVNAGGGWSRIMQFDSGLQWIRFDPNNGKRVYALTAQNGFYRSVDGAQNWQSLVNGLRQFTGGLEVSSLQFVNDQPNTLYLLNRYGLLKSSDAGDSWQALTLITPPLAAKITAFAVNPNNSREVYYATGSTFYSSGDSGVNWETRRLPGRQASPKVMYIHPRDPSIMYMGLTIVPTK